MSYRCEHGIHHTICNCAEEAMRENARLKAELAQAIREREDYLLKIKEQRKEIVTLESQLSLRNQELAALKFTIITTIGGVDYEGFPTSEINYLQRLRILVEKESKVGALESQLASARQALRQALKLPRPWINRSITWKEWDAAFTEVEKALSSTSPGD